MIAPMGREPMRRDFPDSAGHRGAALPPRASRAGACFGVRQAKTGLHVRWRTDGCPRLSNIGKDMAMAAAMGVL